MTSVKAWAEKAREMKEKGLSDREIAEELHLSPETIAWLLTRRESSEHPPVDVKIGWRSVGVMGSRMDMLAMIFVDIIEEEVKKSGKEVDIVVGLPMNGIPLATLVSSLLDAELTLYRKPADNACEMPGCFMSNYASIEGKKAVIIDDVIGTGETMKNAIKALKDEGAEPVLGMVFVNKTQHNMLEEVPIRALVRARAVAGQM